MRSLFSVPLAVLVLTASLCHAETKARLVDSKVIWDGGAHNTESSLVRFKDRWVVAFEESSGAQDADGKIRVIASKDGDKWESLALLESPTPGKEMIGAGITVTPKGQLLVTGMTIVPTPGVADPLPRFGGTVQQMGWTSDDGVTWSDAKGIGDHNYNATRIAWHKNTALMYSHGTICGIAQTIQIRTSTDGLTYMKASELTVSGSFPSRASILVDGDTAYCLKTRITANGNKLMEAELGTSKAPFTQWEWTETEQKISNSQMLKLADGKLIAAIGLSDGTKSRTALAEFEPKTAKFRELLTLPVGNRSLITGVAEHDGHVWVSYHATHLGKSCIHLAKVKLD